jgi:hypothetical protein
VSPPKVSAPVEPYNFLGITSSPLVLGASYDGKTNTVGGVCVTGSQRYVPSSEGLVGNGSSGPSWALVDEIGVGDPVSFEEVTLYGANPAIETWSKAAGDDDARSLNVLYPILEVDEGVVAFAGDDYVKSADCSDHFLTGVVYGARLLVGAKLTFHDGADYDAFITQYGLIYGSGHLDALLNRDDLGWLSVALVGKATIALQGIQIGGDPTKLEAILAQSSCSIGDLAACKQTFNRVADYQQTFVSDLGPAPTSTENVGGWVATFGVPQACSVIPD